MSSKSACTGGGKKEARRSSALPSGLVSRRPSALVSGGVVTAGLLCLLAAHLAIFHRFFGVDTASVTFSRWACLRCLLMSFFLELHALL
jgi:hypothetical protein